MFTGRFLWHRSNASIATVPNSHRLNLTTRPSVVMMRTHFIHAHGYVCMAVSRGVVNV